MLTGAYPHVNGMMGLAQRGFGLNDYSRHMASYLSRQGYETVLSGIQHEGECGSQLGYDKVLIESEDRGQYLPDPEGFDLESAALTAEYIKSRAGRDGNFFLFSPVLMGGRGKASLPYHFGQRKDLCHA